MTHRVLLGGLAACMLMACQAKSPNTEIAAENEVSNEAPQTEVATAPVLETEWVLHGFDAPESIVPGVSPGTFYVSNVNGEGGAKDGNGYISIISDGGEWIEKDWVTGLNAPKGLALVGNDLYVSDIDEVVRINAETGEIVSRTPIPDAQFLNDVVSFNGAVLVSDSGTAIIHAITDDGVSVFMEDERLGGVNGLHDNRDSLLITTMSDGHLLKRMVMNENIIELASGMKNADGIAVLPSKEFIISSWPGELHHVNANGETQIIMDTQGDKIFMNDIFMDDRGLFAPNWQPGTVRKMTVTLPGR